MNLLFDSVNGDLHLKIELNELGIRLGEYNNSERQGIPFLSPCKAILTMKQHKGQNLAFYELEINTLYINMTPTLYQVIY